MSTNDPVKVILKALGEKDNILSVTNCMTRLRFSVKDERQVMESELKELPDVMGLVHDRPNYLEVVVGPAKSRQYAEKCHALGIPAAANDEAKAASVQNSWQENKEQMKSKQKESKFRSLLKIVGDIFVPLIPGIIVSGLCAGFASLMAQLIPDYASRPVWNLLYTLLSLVNTAFMTYITAWAGYRAAERFGSTPILGGMLGLITSLDGINTIAQIIGLYNESSPLDSILRVGKGGVLAVIVGVLILSKVEKAVRKRMPGSLDIIFSPMIALLSVLIPYIVIIMPFFGYVSSGIAWIFGKACMSESSAVRLITGYIAAALFLPMVAAGMHHGMVALYSVQLQELGFVTLYPALAMAGAGQVGAALAILIKAKRKGNERLCSVIKGALSAGIMGVGEPLIYGVTLPMGKPFILAGLGAGFGGAFAMLMQVASTTWGPSGVLGVFVMTSGPRGAVSSIVCYVMGLVISYAMSFLITLLALPDAECAPDEPKPEAPETPKPVDYSVYPVVRHGDPIDLGGLTQEFTFTIRDPLGIHARPAGELVNLLKGFDCRFTVQTDGKTADASSVLSLMTLGAVQGSVLVCRAEGTDAVQAIQVAQAFMEKKL